MDFFYDELNKQANLNAIIDSEEESNDVIVGDISSQKKELQGNIVSNYEEDPYDSQIIYGKLNEELELTYYTGKKTSTTTTTVDNGHMVISVDVNDGTFVKPDTLDETIEETKTELKTYVDKYGGKIDTITFNDILQPIDKNKNVSLNEEDPIFKSSASYNITETDISNWNNKAEKSDIPDVSVYLKKMDAEITYEKLSNKTTILTSESSDSQYPSAKIVYDKIEEVKDIALNKTTNYVVSALTQTDFNSQENSIYINHNITDTKGKVIDISTLNTGDNFYVVEIDLPDRWVEEKTTEGNLTTIKLTKLESSKLPVTDVKINNVSILDNTIANIPIADSSKLGVVKVDSDLGIGLNEDNKLITESASESEIDSKINNYKVITPSNLDYAVKKAITDYKGTTYTDTEKSNARSLIGAISTDVDTLTNYYTKTTTDEKLGLKQDNLTAGTNITIENNVISANGASFDSVLLESDLYTYANVGNIKTATPLNRVQVGSKGDSLTEVWDVLFGQKDEQPEITSQPTISFTFSGYGNNTQEYGTQITSVTLNITKTTGSYTYDGTNTGVTWGENTYKVNDSEVTPSSATILPISYEVGETSALNITILSTNSEGNIAKTLLGKDSNPIKRIESGEKSKTNTFSINSVKYAYSGLTFNTTIPIDSEGKCTLNKRTSSSGTAGTYTFTLQGQYIWLVTPTKISKITWNGNTLSEGEDQDYTYKGEVGLKLDSGATNVTYYAYMMNGTKTGTYTYVVS